MNSGDLDNWRNNVHSRLEELTIMNAKQNSELAHIKESVSEIKTMVKEQNGRVRVLENGASKTNSFVGVITTIFSGLMSYIFMKGL